MDSTTLWTSILVPIMIGPIFLFFKMLYDNYNDKLDKRKLIEFNKEIETIKNKLDKFYWPLYLKLLCIYQINYNLPDNSDSEDGYSSSSNSEIDYQENKCIGYYHKNKVIKCNKYVSRLNKFLLCKKCNKKCNKLGIDKKTNKQIMLKSSVVRDSININIPDEIDQMEYEDELSPDITGNGAGIVNELPLKSLTIDEETLITLTSCINNYYSECSGIIESNINICNPNERLGKELIKFIKYVNIRDIIKNTNDYRAKDFGSKNNLNKILGMIEYDLYSLQNEYNILIHNGPYNKHT